MNTIFLTKKKKTLLFAVILFLLWYALALPSPLFDTPTSLVVEDHNGQLLGARIAADGQWRFPEIAEVPEKFQIALTEFEDRRFFYHPGIDPVGIGRAMVQNIRNGRIVSGGSTLTMQVMRMARNSNSRSIWQKLIETILATRLELRFSKKEILALYASNAPFGGNVVGLEAATWRYFGKKPASLTWAEAAVLAVLPNSPALVHPGRNRNQLWNKRNRLLHRLFQRGILDQLTYELALEEPLPEKPLPLPQQALHLMEQANREVLRTPARSSRIKSTLDKKLQEQATHTLARHQNRLQVNGIYNAAAVIIEIETGNIISYIGNMPSAGNNHSEMVDMVQAPRSTGSILKPILFASALHEGLISPGSFLPDVPTQLQGFKPENYYQAYDGVIPANRALIRSLNIPFVRLLQRYGLEKFHHRLLQSGLHSLKEDAHHYGLTLIVGGAEVSLLEVTSAYASMGRTLKHFHPLNGRYLPDDFRKSTFLPQKRLPLDQQLSVTKPPVLDAASVFLTFQTMQHLERPDQQGNWQQFPSSHPIAWKTGTSIGFRDAWAIGLNRDYAIGVWVGNADGEGRPALVGVQAAAPILFDLFNLLPGSTWYETPFDDFYPVNVCKTSGYLATEICPAKEQTLPKAGQRLPSCQYHQLLHLNQEASERVTGDCYPVNEMKHESWLVLPPAESYFYQFVHPDYRELPPWREGCQPGEKQVREMQLVYPDQPTRIYLPTELDGSAGEVVFKVAHRRPESQLHWHLDHTYLGHTATFHEMAMRPDYGKHQLVIVDEQGNELTQTFEVLNQN